MGDIITSEFVNIGEDAYFADPCPRPSLSASMAKILLDKSPLHAHCRHPRLGKGERQESKTFDAGKLGHKLLLGAGAPIDVVDAEDWRTKAAREQRDAAYMAGHIPALRADYDEAVRAADLIRQRLAAKGIHLTGKSEVQIVWQEAVSGHTPVWCRGMLDHLIVTDHYAMILDLKMSRSAHPRACASHVVDFGYDIQRAAYVRAIEHYYPHVAGRVDFAFLFAEGEAPCDVTVGRLDGALRERGERRWHRAVDLWAECLAFDTWPGYSDGPITIEAPPWVLSSLQETDA